MERLLTLPETPASPLSIRAKALVFHDPHSQQLLQDVERLARSEATVLVIGETGTGKELIARHIHTCSGRRGPFIAVNCGAFSESLIDAELFGHESGAFTGASQSRAGWFEAANGGTLFLDEIGDLSLPLQVKLLRVLQERQVVRLGSRRGIALDVRLVAATNIDLAKAVTAQHFRADLYYRLSVATVRLPALRERPADILPLAQHFVGMYCQRLNLPEGRLSPHAQQTLLNYSWPGNIRELENAIHYALIVCQNGEIQAEDIKLVPLSAAATGHATALVVGGLGTPATVPTPAPPPAHRANSHAELGATRPTHGDGDTDPMQTALERLVNAFETLLDEEPDALLDTVESALVHSAYARLGRNQVRTARVLGITRNMLRTLLKRHGLLERQDALDDAPLQHGVHSPVELHGVLTS